MQNVILRSFTQEAALVSNVKPKNLVELIAYYARISNPANQNNTETSEKLIRYLVSHNHWSPFELVSACLEINTTRDIARQILRHRSFSFNEFSQRYADPTSNLSFYTREARLQDAKNRQNSVQTDDPELQKAWHAKQQQIIHEAQLAYKWAIDKGIAKEQARSVLPEGNTNSRLYMNGTLRSWIHYCQMRTSNGTQLEHREVAWKCVEALEPVFPMIREFVRS